MADIYNGALLTIMAASAVNSHGGLYPDSLSNDQGIALPWTDENGIQSFSLFINGMLPSYEEDIGCGPLFKRGWVLQERLISKRRLIFGSHQIYWNCHEHIQSESGVECFDYSNITWLRHKLLHILASPEYGDADYHANNRRKYNAAHYTRWKFLCGEMSELPLTYETDRLPSLSGLAQSFGRVFPGEFGSLKYAAGLWQEHMPHSLLWKVAAPSSQGEQQYCAPSWSWASCMPSRLNRMNGWKDRYDIDCDLEVLKFDIKLLGTDPYGQVVPGSSITVQGKIRSARLVRLSHDSVWDESPYQVEDKNGNVLGSASLDRYIDLPAEIVCLEGHRPQKQYRYLFQRRVKMRARYLILQTLDSRTSY